MNNTICGQGFLHKACFGINYSTDKIYYKKVACKYYLIPNNWDASKINTAIQPFPVKMYPL